MASFELSNEPKFSRNGAGRQKMKPKNIVKVNLAHPVLKSENFLLNIVNEIFYTTGNL